MSTMHARGKSRRTESGAAAVEFALVAPILIILVFGVISFGIIFGQQLALGNAAREASRYGVVEGRTCSQVTTAAKDAAHTIGMSGTDVTVTVKRGSSSATATNACASSSANPCKGSAAGDSLYVNLAFTSKVNIPLVMEKNVALGSEGVFRCEYS
jgi:Flp pilus assembly protein TadG